MDLSLFLELAINGALSGLMYSLVAMGIVLIYKSSSVPNLAQGAMVMLAGLTVSRYVASAPAPIAVPACAAIEVVADAVRLKISTVPFWRQRM